MLVSNIYHNYIFCNNSACLEIGIINISKIKINIWHFAEIKYIFLNIFTFSFSETTDGEALSLKRDVGRELRDGSHMLGSPYKVWTSHCSGHQRILKEPTVRCFSLGQHFSSYSEVFIVFGSDHWKGFWMRVKVVHLSVPTYL